MKEDPLCVYKLILVCAKHALMVHGNHSKSLVYLFCVNKTHTHTHTHMHTHTHAHTHMHMHIHANTITITTHTSTCKRTHTPGSWHQTLQSPPPAPWCSCPLQRLDASSSLQFPWSSWASALPDHARPVCKVSDNSVRSSVYQITHALWVKFHITVSDPVLYQIMHALCVKFHVTVSDRRNLRDISFIICNLFISSAQLQPQNYMQRIHSSAQTKLDRALLGIVQPNRFESTRAWGEILEYTSLGWGLRVDESRWA